MQADIATYDFNRLYYFAGPNRQRVLLTALANRHGLRSLPALPLVCGVETQEEMQQVLADLSGTCTTLGYTLDDFVIEESGRLYPGHVTAQASFSFSAGSLGCRSAHARAAQYHRRESAAGSRIRRSEARGAGGQGVRGRDVRLGWHSPTADRQHHASFPFAEKEGRG